MLIGSGSKRAKRKSLQGRKMVKEPGGTDGGYWSEAARFVGEVRGDRAGRTSPIGSEPHREAHSGERALDGNAQAGAVLVSVAIDSLELVVSRNTEAT